MDDELHALRAAVALSPREILTTFGLSDYSLPLTALAAWLAQLGIPISESTLRAPSWIGGLLLLTVAPWLVAREHGRRVALAFAALLATSAPLVFYSRFGRPYMPSTALALLAGLLVSRAVTVERARPLVAAVVLGALAVWMLPLAGPFLAGVWVAGIAGEPRRRGWMALAAFGSGSLAIFGLLPAWRSSEALTAKIGGGAVDARSIIRTAEQIAGLDGVAAAAWWVVALLGTWMLLRVRARSARYLVVGVIAQVCALALARPYGLSNPVVASRYLLPVVPVLLLGAAAALSETSRLLTPRLARFAPLVVFASLAIFVGGPLPDLLGGRQAFAGASNVLSGVWPGDSSVRPADRELAKALSARGVRAVAVEPLMTDGDFYRPALGLSRAGGFRTILASPEAALRRKSVGLSTLSTMKPDALLSTSADALVLLQDPGSEIRLAHNAAGTSPLPWNRDTIETLVGLARREDRDLRSRWGEPDLEVRGRAVWDLRRLRAKGVRVEDERRNP